MNKGLQSYVKSYETIRNNMSTTFIGQLRDKPHDLASNSEQVKDKPSIIDQLYALGSKVARNTHNPQDIADQIVLLLNSPDIEINPNTKISLKSTQFPEDVMVSGKELKTNTALYADKLAAQTKDLFQQKLNADNNYYEGKEGRMSNRRKRSAAEA